MHDEGETPVEFIEFGGIGERHLGRGFSDVAGCLATKGAQKVEIFPVQAARHQRSLDNQHADHGIEMGQRHRQPDARIAGDPARQRHVPMPPLAGADFVKIDDALALGEESHNRRIECQRLGLKVARLPCRHRLQRVFIGHEQYPGGGIEHRAYGLDDAAVERGGAVAGCGASRRLRHSGYEAQPFQPVIIFVGEEILRDHQAQRGAKPRAEQDDGAQRDGSEQESDLEQAPPVPAEQPQAISQQGHDDQIRPDHREGDAVEYHLARHLHARHPAFARSDQQQRYQQRENGTANVVKIARWRRQQVRQSVQIEIVNEHARQRDGQQPDRIAPAFFGVDEHVVDQHQPGNRDGHAQNVEQRRYWRAFAGEHEKRAAQQIERQLQRHKAAHGTGEDKIEAQPAVALPDRAQHSDKKADPGRRSQGAGGGQPEGETRRIEDRQHERKRPKGGDHRGKAHPARRRAGGSAPQCRHGKPGKAQKGEEMAEQANVGKLHVDPRSFDNSLAAAARWRQRWVGGARGGRVTRDTGV